MFQLLSTTEKKNRIRHSFVKYSSQVIYFQLKFGGRKRVENASMDQNTETRLLKDHFVETRTCQQLNHVLAITSTLSSTDGGAIYSEGSRLLACKEIDCPIHGQTQLTLINLIQYTLIRIFNVYTHFVSLGNWIFSRICCFSAIQLCLPLRVAESNLSITSEYIKEYGQNLNLRTQDKRMKEMLETIWKREKKSRQRKILKVNARSKRIAVVNGSQ